MTDYLGQAYPALAARLRKTRLAELPTPVDVCRVEVNGERKNIVIKHDEATSKLYGGNKVRKLEYLLQRALLRNARRVATFGTVASNHALATALHAATLDLECTCFLSHQRKTPRVPLVLNMHLRNGTEIVRFGGIRRQRVATMRKHLRGRRAALIPMGGSNWLGVAGFVNAGLELADQVATGIVPEPGRLYVANGTMATTVGLALGLALAGLATEIHAVRVTHEFVANETALNRLAEKSVTLMNRIDASIPADLAMKMRIRHRDGFLGKGYAHSTDAADRAIALAHEQLDLTLDTTYTGKAMAAVLHDLAQGESQDKPVLFWNTYNAEPLPVTASLPDATSALPREFLRYYD